MEDPSKRIDPRNTLTTAKGNEQILTGQFVDVEVKTGRCDVELFKSRLCYSVTSWKNGQGEDGIRTHASIDNEFLHPDFLPIPYMDPISTLRDLQWGELDHHPRYSRMEIDKPPRYV